MSKRKRGVLITILLDVLIGVGVFAYRGGFATTETNALYGALSDAFFVPGVIIASFGIMIYVTGEGLFNIFGYAVNMVALPFLKKNRERMTYYEYIQSKHRKKSDSMGYLCIVGLASVLLGAAFALLTI